MAAQEVLKKLLASKRGVDPRAAKAMLAKMKGKGKGRATAKGKGKVAKGAVGKKFVPMPKNGLPNGKIVAPNPNANTIVSPEVQAAMAKKKFEER